MDDRQQSSSAQPEVPPPLVPPVPLQQLQQLQQQAPAMPVASSRAASLYDLTCVELQWEQNPELMRVANAVDDLLVVRCSVQENPHKNAGAALVLRNLEGVRQDQLLAFLKTLLGDTAWRGADSPFSVVLVRHIDLSGLQVVPEVFNYLLTAAERLGEYFPLRSLELDGCGLGYAEFCALTEATSLLGNLRRLVLSNNDLGLTSLARMCIIPRLFQSAPLEYLALDYTGFSDESLYWTLVYLCQPYRDTVPGNVDNNIANSLQALRLGPLVDGYPLCHATVNLLEVLIKHAPQLQALVVHGLPYQGQIHLLAEWFKKQTTIPQAPWQSVPYRMSTAHLNQLVPAEESPTQHVLPEPTQQEQPGPPHPMLPPHAQLPAAQQVQPPSNPPELPPHAQHAQRTQRPTFQQPQPPLIQPTKPTPAQPAQRPQPAQQQQQPSVQRAQPSPSQQHMGGAGAPSPSPQQQQQQQGTWGGTQRLGGGVALLGGATAAGGAQTPRAAVFPAAARAAREAQHRRQGLVAAAGAGGSVRGMAGCGEQAGGEHSPDRDMAGGVPGTQPTPTTRQTPLPFTPYPHQGEAPATVQGGGGSGSHGADEQQTVSPVRQPPTKRSRAAEQSRGSGQDPGAAPSEAAAGLVQPGAAQQEQGAGPSSSRALQFGPAAGSYPAGAAVEPDRGGRAAASPQPAADDTTALCSDEEDTCVVEVAKTSDGSW